MKTDRDVFLSIISKIVEIDVTPDSTPHKEVNSILFDYPSASGQILSKGAILKAYKQLKRDKSILLTKEQESHFFELIRMKSVRTISGVTPVTVLTKPFPCPGKCIFCPNDVRMPKSYLSNEPGAQRAEANKFDPYYQTYNRLVALHNIGHPTDKIEMIILGGTWTSYPDSYQIWFVKRIFEALNDFDGNQKVSFLEPQELEMPYLDDALKEIYGENINETYNQVVTKALNAKKDVKKFETATWDELFEKHSKNEVAKSKCVGLVIETRPDEINEDEVLMIRKLGATKIQLGVQSLNDTVLLQNKRGHDVATTAKAFKLIRDAGFKIHIHWMPNLLGSTPEKDIEDYKTLFSDVRFRPDEVKIYPCSLIESAELMKYYKDGSWKPYSEEELMYVLKEAYLATPNYCRITRMIRDIPSTDIVSGNLKTNFRQLVESNMVKNNNIPVEIRSREIRDKLVNTNNLELRTTTYITEGSEEHFIEYVTDTNKIAGFLRLSLPSSGDLVFINELTHAAIIREVHVYGRSLEVGKNSQGKAQHSGLGTQLIEHAVSQSHAKGFGKLAVISSVGTRDYYKKFGFKQEGLYQVREI